MSVNKPKIEGGYYIKARKIQESDVAHYPPHVREIWDWLLWKCSYGAGDKLKRGQCYVSYKMIQDGLHWMIGWRKATYTKHQIDQAMKTLRNATMITTTKTTRGMVVTVLNYDLYQNYKNYLQPKKATGQPQTSDAIVKHNNKVNNIKEIVSFLNKESGHSYSPDTKETIKLISGRLSEGRTLDDFKLIIRFKIREWVGTSMEQRITPSTLFAQSNFEKYLMAAKKENKPPTAQRGTRV